MIRVMPPRSRKIPTTADTQPAASSLDSLLDSLTRNDAPYVRDLVRALGESVVTDAELTKRGFGDRTTRHRAVREGRFPQPLRLSPGRKVWRWTTILRWLDQQERDPVQPRPTFARRRSAPAPGPTAPPPPFH